MRGSVRRLRAGRVTAGELPSIAHVHETRPLGHQRSPGSPVGVRPNGQPLDDDWLGDISDDDWSEHPPPRAERPSPSYEELPSSEGDARHDPAADPGARAGRLHRGPPRRHRTPTPRRRARGRGGHRTCGCERGAVPPGRRTGNRGPRTRLHRDDARAGRDPSVGGADRVGLIANVVVDHAVDERVLSRSPRARSSSALKVMVKVIPCSSKSSRRP